MIGLCYHRVIVFTAPTKPRAWAGVPWWFTAPWLSQSFCEMEGLQRSAAFVVCLSSLLVNSVQQPVALQKFALKFIPDS